MRVATISDLQGLFWKITPSMLPPADLLIIAGDLTNVGTMRELMSFDNWLGTLNYRYIVYVGGNHDLGLARGINGRTFFVHGSYLENTAIEIEGIKIYGTPASNCGIYAPNWVFCEQNYVKWAADNIPDNIDILISHGPSYGVLDIVKDNEHAGSKHILDAVERTNPKFHIFGHIHSSHGMVGEGGTTFINAALCNDYNELFKDNKLYYEPIAFDIK